VTGLFQRDQSCVMCGVILAFGAQVDKEPIAAVQRGIAERLAIDRDQALAVLAGGFRDQLFCPGPQDRTIESVCFKSVRRSMPAAAAGTSPNGDSTE